MHAFFFFLSINKSIHPNQVQACPLCTTFSFRSVGKRYKLRDDSVECAAFETITLSVCTQTPKVFCKCNSKTKSCTSSCCRKITWKAQISFCDAAHVLTCSSRYHICPQLYDHSASHLATYLDIHINLWIHFTLLCWWCLLVGQKLMNMQYCSRYQDVDCYMLFCLQFVDSLYQCQLLIPWQHPLQWLPL